MDRNTAIDNVISLVESNQFAAAFSANSALIAQLNEELENISDFGAVKVEDLDENDDQELIQEIENLGYAITSLEDACAPLLALDSAEAISCLQAAKF